MYLSVGGTHLLLIDEHLVKSHFALALRNRIKFVAVKQICHATTLGLQCCGCVSSTNQFCDIKNQKILVICPAGSQQTLIKVRQGISYDSTNAVR